MAESPDENETDRVVAEIEKYHVELAVAYKQANDDSDKDFERLGQLLKENLYSWWDWGWLFFLIRDNPDESLYWYRK